MTTSKTVYRAGYGPFMPGVAVAPFPYVAQWKKWAPGADKMTEAEAEEACVASCLEQLRLVLACQMAPSEVWHPPQPPALCCSQFFTVVHARLSCSLHAEFACSSDAEFAMFIPRRVCMFIRR